MRAAAAALMTVLVAASGGCLGPGDFRCGSHEQCGPNGFCEADGRCSLPVADEVCRSRRRYAHRAGPVADTCVSASCPADPIATVASGSAHACLLRAGGRIQCWGRNDDGQVGDGTRTARSLPVNVAAVTAATAVATGQRHSCAIQGADRQVVCWGADDLGQLGDGGGPTRLRPVDVAGVNGAVAVAAGADFSCAALASGTVTCWGDASVGQLGDGRFAPGPHPPVTVDALAGATTLSAFSQHACAVRSDGLLLCWGSNAQGQLGDGTTTNRAVPVAVDGLPEVRAVGTGVSHTCALTAGGLFCWGSDAAGQLGDGRSDGAPVTAPVAVPVPNAVALGVGALHTCAVQAPSGAVLCWGEAGGGQLGTGPIPMLVSPVAISRFSGATAIAAGAAFTCARTDDGAVFCWGDNHFGQLGIGSGVVQPRPVAVPDVAEVVALATGAAHTCAATAAGQMQPLCWGANPAGQLGDGTTTDRASAKAVTAEVAAGALSAGGAHTCALGTGTSGALWCWGRGNVGQLGLGPNRLFDARQPQPIALPGGTATAVTTGATHTCAAAGDGSLFCFGDNGDGQLGDGTTDDRSTATRVAFPAGAETVRTARVSAGGAHTCAIDAAGALWCWGRGDEGQLGDGGRVGRLSPALTSVAPESAARSTITAVSAGAAHTCAIAGSAVYCWGRGASGQLGTGAIDDAATATRVNGVPDALDVAAGAAHTCALARAGTVLCWGANESGQLGNGSTADSATPVAVPGLIDATGIAAGGAHTCARRSGGDVLCWGSDSSGQLGDGVLLSSIVPQLARVACE